VNTRERLERARVYRFDNAVAVWLGGETVYMTPAMARKLARGLAEAVHDIKRYPSAAASKLGTLHLTNTPEKEG